ncbi:MAG: hypothetical protein HZA08_02175 [Nitrospirae bacterium]|nr:hypothetical protein [Nitrospirota bacterium]
MKYITLIFALLILTACTSKEPSKKLITVLPESTVVKMDATEQFSVSPSGTSVTWGIKNDSEPLLGVIDSSGSYKAPSDPSTAPEKVVLTATDSSGTTGSATAFLTTFNNNKRLTKHYAEGKNKADTYSSGQKGIAVFKDSGNNVNIYTVWADNSLGNSHVWFSKSSDNGVTFPQLVPIDESSSAKQNSPAIGVYNSGNAYAVWEDYREGDADILMSIYNGNSFSAVKKINQDIFGSLDYDSSPSIAISNSGEICIVWEYRENSLDIDKYPDIYFARSTDAGQTFSQVKISVNGRRPSIAVDSDGIAYLVWEDLTGFPTPSQTHILMSKVINTTASIPKQVDSITGSDSQARFPSVAVTPDGNKVYVSWQRAEITSPAFEKEVTNSYDIDLAIIDVASDTITQRLSIPDSSNAGYIGGPAYPSIASDNNYVYIVWDDQRNGTKDIYFAKKSSDGVTFTTNRIVNDDLGTWHEKPSVAVIDGKGYVIWTDYRNTSGDVFFARE